MRVGVTVTATVPRMVPQLWGCGLHWSGSIGNNTTDARGWNWALGPAMDGWGLVEVDAEVNGSKRSHHRRGQTERGWVDVGWMLDVDRWERGEELGAAGAAGEHQQRELLLAWRPEQEGGEAGTGFQLLTSKLLGLALKLTLLCARTSCVSWIGDALACCCTLALHCIASCIRADYAFSHPYIDRGTKVVDPTTVPSVQHQQGDGRAAPPPSRNKQTNQQHAASAGRAGRHTAVTV